MFGVNNLECVRNSDSACFVYNPTVRRRGVLGSKHAMLGPTPGSVGTLTRGSLGRCGPARVDCIVSEQTRKCVFGSSNDLWSFSYCCKIVDNCLCLYLSCCVDSRKLFVVIPRLAAATLIYSWARGLRPRQV